MFDVIKKSVLDQFAQGISIADMLWSLGVAFLMGLFILLVYKQTFRGVLSVSYTHLDVYKRQGMVQSMWKKVLAMVSGALPKKLPNTRPQRMVDTPQLRNSRRLRAMASSGRHLRSRKAAPRTSSRP